MGVCSRRHSRDLEEARHLPRAVEHRAARGDRPAGELLRRPGTDDGDAGAGDHGVVAGDRDVPHAHAGDVGDRVGRARLQLADAQPVVAEAHGAPTLDHRARG